MQLTKQVSPGVNPLVTRIHTKLHYDGRIWHASEPAMRSKNETIKATSGVLTACQRSKEYSSHGNFYQVGSEGIQGWFLKVLCA